ncbi:SapC family protein, partial [Colwellia sp. BRX8-8]|nr:SapC family protein [Colwellia sp. BRX8-8]
DEEAFKDLNDADYQELKDKGFLAAIYSCLFSTQRIAKLISLSEN